MRHFRAVQVNDECDDTRAGVQGVTALMAAAQQGNLDAMAVLVEAKAAIDKRTPLKSPSFGRISQPR